jgi:hypothetical protein
MPPFASQDSPTIGFDETPFVDVPLVFTKQNDALNNAYNAATDFSLTESERSSFFERMFDLNLCCSFNSGSSLPNTNLKSDSLIEEIKEETSEYNAARKYLVQQQIVKDIHMDVLMKKAAEANRLEAAERSASAFVGATSDDITVPFKTVEKEQKPSSMIKLTNSLKNDDTGKKPSLMNRVEKSFSVKKGNKAVSVSDTKNKRMPTTYTQKSTSTRTPNSRDNIKNTGMMKRATKSMSLKKFKRAKAEREMLVDKEKKSRMPLSLKKVKKNSCVKRSFSLKKDKSNRTDSDLSSKQKKKRSMKKAKSNKKRQDIDHASSSSSEKKTNMGLMQHVNKLFSKKRTNDNNSVNEVTVDWSQKL